MASISPRTPTPGSILNRRFDGPNLQIPITKKVGTISANARRFSSDCDDADATELGAVIVSVALPPALTVEGAIVHEAIGAGPVTEHPSEIVPENPPCAPKVRTSAVWAPALSERLDCAGLTVKSGGNANVAVIEDEAFKVTAQGFGSVLLHAPDQPAKLDPTTGDASKVYVLPGSAGPRVQLPLVHTIPPLLTSPLPSPAIFTVNVTPVTKFAVTLLSESMVISQPEGPEQAPPHELKRALPDW